MLTTSGLQLGIGLPQVFPGGMVDTDLIRRFALRAEALGYEDLWLTDNVLGGNGTLEPVTLLTYVAGFTRRIRLGVSVLILNQRNPVQLAKALASLDQLSRGRLTVGVGLGGGTALYPAFGISAERPVARFIEGLRLMRALWSEERVTLRGDFWRLEDAAMTPKPLQQPLPVWLGGHAPAALRRAVRLGDGWMGAGGSRIEDFFREIAQVRQYLTEAGRDPSSFTLSKRVYIAVDADAERARERLAAGLLQQYGSSRMAASAGVAGTPRQCVETLRAMRDAGLQHLLLHPFADAVQQLELLSREIAPEL
jgi:probable F420-dependent oxidoreductase